MDKEKEIQSYMKNLDLTREEAEELWVDDHSEVDLPEVQELTKKAKTMKRMYVQSDKPRRKTPKERKIDNDKKYILSICSDALGNIVEITGQQTETEIYFKYNGFEYTLKLTKHRPKKK